MDELSKEVKGVSKEITEVKASITAGSKPTYAETVSSSPISNTTPNIKANMLSPEEKHKLEREKKDRALYEITLTMRDATAETKQTLKSDKRDDIKAAFQKFINERSPHDKPIIQAINTLGDTTLKLHFRSKEEAAKIRSLNVNWSQAYDGVKTHNPQFGIIVHGVPTAETEGEIEHLIRQWEEQNDVYGNLKITKITPL